MLRPWARRKLCIGTPILVMNMEASEVLVEQFLVGMPEEL